MYRLQLLLCVALCACAASSYQLTRATRSTYPLEDAEALFEKFIVDHNKQYADESEKQMRFEIFKQTLKEINALNERHGGIRVFDINSFSDYTPEEKRFLKGFNPNATDVASSCKILTDADIPDANAPNSWDWRDQNVVTPVKNQGHCGACYAFSSTGNIEGQYRRRHGRLLSFSEQQIVDCSKGKYSKGCDGGLMSRTFQYIMDAGGIELESDYVYTALENQCKFDKSKVKAQLTGCNTYKLQSQEKLKQLVYSIGPIAIAVDSTEFHPYSGNVLTNCELNQLDHGVLIVGYGTDPAQGDYWIIKNSWGTGWGESGYIRVERGEGKASCGLLNDGMASAVVA